MPSQTLKAALAAGADRIVLCDTNGGTLPHDLTAAVMKVAAVVPPERLGIHAHNDGGLAVANTIAAVQAGVAMVQGTVNGYGERCGNADLTTVIANLQLKMNRPCIPEASLRQLTNLSYYVSEVANVRPIPFRPFVGRSAFAHKGGVHVHAVAKNPQAYEHIPPEWVGNHQRVVVSDLAGKSNIAFKAKEFGIDVGTNDALNKKIVREIKRLEDQGFQFDAADGSLALLMKKITGAFKEPFTLECFSVTNGKTGNRPSLCQATIKISVGDEVELTAAEGNGPVNALDHALRKALTKFYPQIERDAPGRLQGPHRGGERGNGGAGQGAPRLAGRGGAVEHDRRLGEHHRGELAGPGGQHPVQAEQGQPQQERPAAEYPLTSPTAFLTLPCGKTGPPAHVRGGRCNGAVTDEHEDYQSRLRSQRQDTAMACADHGDTACHADLRRESPCCR